MMKKRRVSLIKTMIGGMLLFAAMPPALYWSWGHAYAAADSAAMHSVSDMAQKLTAAMNNRRATITFTYEGRTSTLKSQIQSAINQAMGSDPYLYYNIDRYVYNYRGNTKSASVTVQVEYRESLQQTAYVNQQVKAILAQIITPGMNSHQKVKAIHDWVVLHLKYDNSYSKYTAYEGLQSGSAVCQGYSLLTYKLLMGAGIKNKIVEGTARAPGKAAQSHAWNLVLLDGRWYHLDTTWDDPLDGPEGELSTAYYMRTDAQMRRDHSWVKSYPAASVSYPQTLTELVEKGGAGVPAYQQLQKELDYELYDESRVVRTSAEIVKLAEAAIATGEPSILFRYEGSTRQLEVDLQELYSLGFDRLSYTTTDFDNTGDLKVYVTWK